MADMSCNLIICVIYVDCYNTATITVQSIRKFCLYIYYVFKLILSVISS